MTDNIHSIEDLTIEAADALIRRDPQRLEEIEDVARNWMQTDRERMAQTRLLQAMTEAANLVADEPSAVG